MIDKLGQVPQLPPDARGDNGESAGDRGGDMFAQLLGVARAMPQPGTGLGADVLGPVGGATSEDVARAAMAPTGARMFNQDGFFGHAIGGTEDVGGFRVAQGAEVEAEAGPVAGEQGQRGSDPERPGIQAVGRACAVSGDGAEKGRSVAPPRGPARLQGGAGRIDARVPSPAEPDAPEITGEQAASPTRARLLRGMAAARSPIHVAMRAVEQGLAVSARVEGLDEVERRQLRDEIAALLGRHGLAARIEIHTISVRESQR